MTGPLFETPRPQFVEVEVQWVPQVTTEQYVVFLMGVAVYALCADGLKVEAGDRALAQWVGRTLRIVQLVAKAPKTTTDTEEPQ